MTISPSPHLVIPMPLGSTPDPLRRAVAAHLTRYTGTTRVHTESDLRAFLTWCQERELEPLSATRVHVELYIRWMQEVRHYAPATVSRRISVLAGFFQTAVIDGVLPASPAEHVRRPHVPPESPTLGLTHLQFEAMLHALGPAPTSTTSPSSSCSGSWACGSSRPAAPMSRTCARSTATAS